MNKNKLILFILLVLLATTAVALTACADDTPTSELYTVMLPQGEGYEIQGGGYIQKVEKSSKDPILFEITIEDGYVFVYTNFGEYNDGKLILSDINYDLTIEFRVKKLDDIIKVKDGTVSYFVPDGGELEFGKTVVFSIIPNEHYVVEKLSINSVETEFERQANGSVQISEILQEKLSIESICLGEECAITIEQADFGTITSSADDGFARYGDEIRLFCTPNSDYRLAYLDVKNKRFFYSPDFWITVDGNMTIKAKFIDESFWTLSYDFNGGEFIGDELSAEFALQEQSVYTDNGFKKWKKDGYTLESWNTEPDGSGERHALGAMIPMPNNDLMLYAIYKKQTTIDQFTFAEFEGKYELGYEITAYNGGDVSEVVIPDSYNGSKVLSIGNDVFNGNDDITSIVTTSVLEKIGDNALANMQNLKSVLIFDLLRNLSESAFKGSENIEKIRFNSASRRVYEPIIETSLVDKQMRVQTSKKKKIVTLSGCSLARGMDSTMIVSDPYLGEYDIVNMGVHAGYGLGHLMDFVDNYINKDDIIVFALENYDQIWMTETGNDIISRLVPQKLSAFESNYDLYEEINVAESKNRNPIIPLLSKWLNNRSNDIDNNRDFTSWINRTDVNKYGDFTYHRADAKEGQISQTHVALFTNVGYLSGVNKINSWAQKHIDKGTKVFFIYPPVYRYNAYNEPINVANREAFETQLRVKLSFPVLGGIDDIAQPVNNMADWVNHLSTNGAKAYTQTFINLLKSGLKL